MSQEDEKTVLDAISSSIDIVKDFPKEGIYFRNISPLLTNHNLFQETLKMMAKCIVNSGLEFDYIAGMESRGFLFIQLANMFKCGFVMLRKPKKLPNVVTFTYEKEYGSDSLTIEKNVMRKGSRVLIVDDLIATCGTIYAAMNLVKMVECDVVGAIGLIELDGLPIYEPFRGCDMPVLSVLKYPFDSDSPERVI